MFLGVSSCSFYKTTSTNNRQKSSLDLVPFQDTLTSLFVYDYVEEMPRYGKSRVVFIEDFINKLSTTDVLCSLPVKINVSFVISESGDVLGARFVGNRKAFSQEDEETILSIIESLDKWVPGRHNNKNVNVILTLPIIIDPR